MGVAWRDFTLDTPSWNALNYIDSMLRDSRDPVFNVFTPARTSDNHDPFPAVIVANNVDSDIVVGIVCFALAEHSTQVVLIVSGPVSVQVCEAERDNLVNEIIGLDLN